MWRERKVAGAHLTYAARGTQDLTWEVPILGNTLPRVYTPGYLPTRGVSCDSYVDSTYFRNFEDVTGIKLR